MSNMLRTIAFFCVGLGLVRAGFFDLTDVDDPLSLLWNLPIHDKLSKCKIDDNRHGMCMDKAKCILSGGTPTGHCGLIFTCCSYDTNCVKTSEKKQAYFNSGNLNAAVTKCKYTIKLRNRNVCQVRLDFEHLTLASTILTSSSTSPQDQEIFSCANDILKINPHSYGVPVLCGNNTGQHLYVHVNQTTDPNNAVNIDISLANRLNELNKHLPKPSWKIKFTQLECPLKKHKFDLSKFGEAENVNNDFNVLAPQGAIQYLTDVVGEVWSFAFNTTKALVAEETTSYPYQEHYTIAFRRSTDVCGIKFSPVSLYLHHSEVNKFVTCHHYLFIPEYYPEDAEQVDEGVTKICTGDSTFYSLVPGPLYISFKSMDISQTTKQDKAYNQGFFLRYELMTDCPRNTN